MDKSKFKQFGLDSKNCWELAAMILDKYGIKNPGEPGRVIRLTDTSNKKRVEYWGKNPAANYAEGIRCLDAHLEARRVIIVGVDYDVAKTIPENPDGTDHYIVVTGRGYDTSKGMYYYTFMDTGTPSIEKGCSLENRLYYDPENLTLRGHTEYRLDEYVVTHIRPNDGNVYQTNAVWEGSIESDKE